MDDEQLRPVKKRIRVALDPGAAFDLFTAGMDRWWPFERHSVFLTLFQSFTFECRENGSLVETGPGGETAVWATVTAVDRPRRILLSWHPGRAVETAQDLAVTFEPAGEGTVVSLLQSGWERLGEHAGEVRADYQANWDYTFVNCYGKAAGITR